VLLQVFREGILMTDLPAPLVPLEENRRELLATLGLLDDSVESTVRADLASELVGICSRYEDVKDRVVYPALRAMSADSVEIGRAEEDQRAVREALSEIRNRTLHVKPQNVHADDPVGFEKALRDAIETIRGHIEHEDELLFPMLGELDAQASAELRQNVEHAIAHASTHPNPRHNPLGRAVVAVEEWLEKGTRDESTPWHPGVDKLDDEIANATPVGDQRVPDVGNEPDT
jgi:hypothetical protein